MRSPPHHQCMALESGDCTHPGSLKAAESNLVIKSYCPFTPHLTDSLKFLTIKGLKELKKTSCPNDTFQPNF